MEESKSCGVASRARYLVSRVVDKQQFGEDGRAGVAAAKLAHLPLLGQHPQRIADFGAQSAIEVLRART